MFGRWSAAAQTDIIAEATPILAKMFAFLMLNGFALHKDATASLFLASEFLACSLL